VTRCKIKQLRIKSDSVAWAGEEEKDEGNGIDFFLTLLACAIELIFCHHAMIITLHARLSLPDCDSHKFSLSVRLNDHHRYNNNNNNDIDNSLLSESKGSIMNSHHSATDYGHMSSGADNGSGKFSTALSRLKYGYDYKPLMRTFTRRFDSPTKVHF
jgi:hypothetical protein